MGKPLRVGATARFAGTVRLKVVPAAVLGPLLVKVTVPDTVWPALTLAGKVAVVAASASALPAIVAVTLLLFGFGSAVVALMLAVTVEVPEPGWIKLSVMGPTLLPEIMLVGMPVSVMTPVAAV